MNSVNIIWLNLVSRASPQTYAHLAQSSLDGLLRCVPGRYLDCRRQQVSWRGYDYDSINALSSIALRHFSGPASCTGSSTLARTMRTAMRFVVCLLAAAVSMADPEPACAMYGVCRPPGDSPFEARSINCANPEAIPQFIFNSIKKF